jgi:phage gpG-like protein
MAEILSVDVTDADVIGLLQRTAEKLTDLSELYSLMGAVMERNIKLRFETKTDPNGATWTALAPSTERSYLAMFDGRIPGSLLHRGRIDKDGYHQPEMLNSLTHNILADGLEVGFSIERAAYHETGTKDGKLPKRSMLLGDWQTGTLGEGDRVDLANEIEDFLSQQL